MKTVTFTPPVYLPGDDLECCLDESVSVAEAFLKQSKFYEQAAQMCKQMASIAAENEFKIWTSGEFIDITVEDNVADKIIQNQLGELTGYDVNFDSDDDLEIDEDDEQ